MKILVIDDEKPTLSMFKLFLTAYGYEVWTAENGEQGLEVFKEVQPEIVFTDIRMPGIDGLEVLAHIRQMNPQCQVIIITGHGDMERAVEALDMDASDFINKPVERQALNAALVRAEKRVLMPEEQPFCLTPAWDGNTLTIEVFGKLSGGGAPVLTEVIQSRETIFKVIFKFDSSFSIDRRGISLLMDTLQKIKEKDSRIHMKGLSYNYCRFFEMAGMDKMAVLEAAITEEPGL